MSAPTASSSTSSSCTELREVFDCFDKDGDGKLSAVELSLCMSSIGEELSVEEAEEFVELVDSNGDGMLDFDEFLQVVEGEEDEKSKGLRGAFEMYESDGEEGCITPKSLKRMLSRLGESREIADCRAMICRFDINGDGVISFEEFKLMMV